MTISLQANSAGTAGQINIGATPVLVLPQVIPDFTDDTTAAVGGVPLQGLYRTGSTLKVRVS